MGASPRGRTSGVPLQPPLRPRASVTGGSSMTVSSIFSSVLWTPPLASSGYHPVVRCAWQRQMLRALALFLLSASRNFRVGTRRTCTTPVDVLTPESGTTALGSSFGTREHINARAWESVRACDEMRFCDWQLRIWMCVPWYHRLCDKHVDEGATRCCI